MKMNLPLVGVGESLEVGDSFQGILTFPNEIINGVLPILVWFNIEASKQIRCANLSTLSDKYLAGTFSASKDSHGILWLSLDSAKTKTDQEIADYLVSFKKNIASTLHLMVVYEPISMAAFYALQELAELRMARSLSKKIH